MIEVLFGSAGHLGTAFIWKVVNKVVEWKTGLPQATTDKVRGDNEGTLVEKRSQAMERLINRGVSARHAAHLVGWGDKWDRVGALTLALPAPNPDPPDSEPAPPP